MKYLFIFESGEMAMADDLRTSDLDAIADGLLTVVTTHEGVFHEVNDEGQWEEIKHV